MKQSTRTILLVCVLALVYGTILVVGAKFVESFAASAGGTLIQLTANRLSTAEEAEQAMKMDAYRVQKDIVDMTEPENSYKYKDVDTFTEPIQANAHPVRV